MFVSLQGQLLIAAPRLRDPNFFRAVVLIVQHNEQGALGLVLHRPIDISVAAAWEQISHTPCEVSGQLQRGGPCEGVIMAVHDDAESADAHVIENIHFTTAKSSLEHLVEKAGVRVRLFIGYAGWTAGQLENEVAENAWLSLPATAERVFDSTVGSWSSLVKLLDRAAMSQWMNEKIVPDDPSMN